MLGLTLFSSSVPSTVPFLFRTGWDVSRVTTLSWTFWNCAKFTGEGLEKWTTSKVTTLDNTFNSRWGSKFNPDLGGWDVSAVKSIVKTFYFPANAEGEGNVYQGKGLEKWNLHADTQVDQTTLTFVSTFVIPACTKYLIYSKWLVQPKYTPKGTCAGGDGTECTDVSKGIPDCAGVVRDQPTIAATCKDTMYSYSCGTKQCTRNCQWKQTTGWTPIQLQYQLWNQINPSLSKCNVSETRPSVLLRGDTS